MTIRHRLIDLARAILGLVALAMLTATLIGIDQGRDAAAAVMAALAVAAMVSIALFDLQRILDNTKGRHFLQLVLEDRDLTIADLRRQLLDRQNAATFSEFRRQRAAGEIVPASAEMTATEVAAHDMSVAMRAAAAETVTAGVDVQADGKLAVSELPVARGPMIAEDADGKPMPSIVDMARYTIANPHEVGAMDGYSPTAVNVFEGEPERARTYLEIEGLWDSLDASEAAAAQSPRMTDDGLLDAVEEVEAMDTRRPGANGFVCDLAARLADRYAGRSVSIGWGEVERGGERNDAYIDGKCIQGVVVVDGADGILLSVVSEGGPRFKLDGRIGVCLVPREDADDAEYTRSMVDAPIYERIATLAPYAAEPAVDALNKAEQAEPTKAGPLALDDDDTTIRDAKGRFAKRKA